MKKINYLLFSGVLFTLLISNVSASFSLNSSTYSARPNSNITVTGTLSSSGGAIVSIEGSITCSGAGVSKSTSLNFDDMSNSIKSKSFSISIKPTSKGTITCSSSGVRYTNMTSSSWNNESSKSITINVSQQSSSSSPQKKDDRSSNNDLKSFGIEGYEISPEFSKGTTEYTVTVPYDTKEIQINAYKDDDKASISGDDGVKEVNTGENKFTTVITAENGSKKSYSITVYVEEEPIKIKVDNKEYNLVTKEEDLPELKTEHEVISLNIQDREVKAYRIDSISYVLVGLKDENGLVTLYKYDSYKDEEKEDKYTIYQELNSESINLVLKDAPNIPFGYTKEIIKINEKEVTAYKKEEGFYLVYGMNVENGKESFYTYDKEEKTFQRYLETDVISTDLLKLIFIAIALVLSILLGIITALSIKVSQYKPKKEKKEKIKKEKKEKVKKEKPKKEKKNKKIKVTKVEDKKAIELEIPKEEK